MTVKSDLIEPHSQNALAKGTGLSASMGPEARQQSFVQSDPLSDIVVSSFVVPEACQTMAEVREGVDELDRYLVRLLARRQRFMDAAARIKPEFNHVRDEKRIEDVVSKVLATGVNEGLSPEIAEPVWRQLIEQCIAYEGTVWHKLRP